MTVKFITDRMLYVIIQGRWYIIFLNVHVPTQDKSNDLKDSSCEELECVFDHFPKYQMKILLGDFNAKVGRTIRNESLHEISNHTGVRVTNYATLKNLSRVQCSHTTTLINTLELLLIGRHTITFIMS
jgi:hypothetical protein